MPESTTTGLIDVGSNAIRMKIVRASGDQVEVVQERREPVRLGSSVIEHGRISAELLDATVEVFRSFAVDLATAGCDRVTAVATAAARGAANRAELVERIATATGLNLQVISGQEEAELLAYAMSARIDASTGQSLWLDLGAGSVEVVAQSAGEVRAASYPLGALRLLEDALAGAADHGPTMVDALARHIASFSSAIQGQLRGPVHRFAACGGSLDRLEELMAAAGDGHRVDGVAAQSLDRLAAWQERLANLTRAERMATFDLPPDRADTVVPAAAVTLAIGRLAGVDTVLVPRVGLKEGLLARMLETDR